MKRLALAGIFALLIASACAADKIKPVTTDDDAVDHAVAVIQQYRLTSEDVKCLYYDTNDEGATWVVRVRENHTPPCKGFAESSPTLFLLKIRKRDGHTTTDRDSTDGSYHELKRQSS